MHRVLVVAYACNPKMGSEPGIGWNWIAAMARRGWHVTALTSAVHQDDTISYMAENPQDWMSRIELVPLGSRSFQNHILSFKLLTYPYQLLWQWLAYAHARKLNRAQPFAIVHSHTYGGIRIPSFMGMLGIPFLLGPLGGGEQSPMALVWPLGAKASGKELLRSASNLMVRMSPLSWLRFGQATRILAKTDESARAIGRRYAHKMKLVNDVGTRPVKERSARAQQSGEKRIIFAGRFLYWKGGEHALHGFALHVASGGEGVFEMIGTGPCVDRWKALAARLGIADRTVFTPWLAQDQFLSRLAVADAFLFPSLHDSGGSVVFETLSLGTPLICLDLGGPGLLMRRIGLDCVAVEGASPREVHQRIADSIRTVLAGESDQIAKRDAIVSYFDTNTWDDLVTQAYDGLLA